MKNKIFLLAILFCSCSQYKYVITSVYITLEKEGVYTFIPVNDKAIKHIGKNDQRLYFIGNENDYLTGDTIKCRKNGIKKNY